jgi:hypothetical protein
MLYADHLFHCVVNKGFNLIRFLYFNAYPYQLLSLAH